MSALDPGKIDGNGSSTDEPLKGLMTPRAGDVGRAIRPPISELDESVRTPEGVRVPLLSYGEIPTENISRRMLLMDQQSVSGCQIIFIQDFLKEKETSIHSNRFLQKYR
jgi:hypothetical protein